MKIGEAIQRAIRPDAQAFDEVRIVTVPRYKMSGMSGDEWRISAKIQLLRKGEVRHEVGYRDVATAAQFLPYVIAQAHDDGKAFYAGEDNHCDQEGCAEQATVTLRMKKGYCRSCGESRDYDDYEKNGRIVIRKFCARHSKRGDCGIDDADANYVLLDGVPGIPAPSDMKESGHVVVEVDSIDQIPAAIAQARKEIAE